MKTLVTVCCMVALAGAGVGRTAGGPVAEAVAWLEGRQADSGGFGESGAPPNASATAWVAFALAAGGGSTATRERALAFLRAHEGEARSETDVALHALGRMALGDRPEPLLARLREHRPGKLVNATIWAALALAGAGERPPTRFVDAILTAQRPDGGWSWLRGGASDSNDTAAAIQALRAAGTGRAAIRRGLVALRRFARADGGFGLTRGRQSDAQSTAWAIQALRAAGARVGTAPFRYLAAMRRPDGSYRYSAAYAATPVWVTSQVAVALSGRTFPLRP